MSRVFSSIFAMFLQSMGRRHSRDSGIVPGDLNLTENDASEEIFGTINHPDAPPPIRKQQSLLEGPPLPPRNVKQLSASSNEDGDHFLAKQNAFLPLDKEDKSSALMAMTNGPNQCCDLTAENTLYPNPASDLSYPHLSQLGNMGRRTLTSKKAIKTIHEFVLNERHAGVQGTPLRSAAARPSICNPVMRPNYTSSMLQVTPGGLRVVNIEQQRRQRLSNAINGTYRNDVAHSCAGPANDMGAAKKITSSLYPNADSRHPTNLNFSTPNIKPPLHPITSTLPSSDLHNNSQELYENEHDHYDSNPGTQQNFVQPSATPTSPPTQSSRSRIQRQAAVEKGKSIDFVSSCCGSFFNFCF